MIDYVSHVERMARELHAQAAEVADQMLRESCTGADNIIDKIAEGDKVYPAQLAKWLCDSLRDASIMRGSGGTFPCPFFEAAVAAHMRTSAKKMVAERQ